MSLPHPIASDGAAYRRGLVLGLTMAEVVLLIVFALLIALAAIWRAEQESKEALAREVQQHEAQAAPPRDPMRLPQKRALPPAWGAPQLFVDSVFQYTAYRSPNSLYRGIKRVAFSWPTV